MPGYTGHPIVIVEHPHFVELFGMQRHLLAALGLLREDTRSDRDNHIAVSWSGADKLSHLLFEKVGRLGNYFWMKC